MHKQAGVTCWRFVILMLFWWTQWRGLAWHFIIDKFIGAYYFVLWGYKKPNLKKLQKAIALQMSKVLICMISFKKYISKISATTPMSQWVSIGANIAELLEVVLEWLQFITNKNFCPKHTGKVPVKTCLWFPNRCLYVLILTLDLGSILHTCHDKRYIKNILLSCCVQWMLHCKCIFPSLLCMNAWYHMLQNTLTLSAWKPPQISSQAIHFPILADNSCHTGKHWDIPAASGTLMKNMLHIHVENFGDACYQPSCYLNSTLTKA